MGDNNRLDANHDITLNWRNKQKRDNQRQQSAELNPIQSLDGPLGVLLFQGFFLRFNSKVPSHLDLTWHRTLTSQIMQNFPTFLFDDLSRKVFNVGLRYGSCVASISMPLPIQ